mgnify:CR=1 FL=1
MSQFTMPLLLCLTLNLVMVELTLPNPVLSLIASRVLGAIRKLMAVTNSAKGSALSCFSARQVFRSLLYLLTDLGRKSLGIRWG